MILLIYVTHNNEINSLMLFVLDLLKRGEIAHPGGGCGMPCDGIMKHSAWAESRKPARPASSSPIVLGKLGSVGP
jgi:hypothetical protein